MPKSIINVTADNFEAEVKNSSIPVLVDFWAPWCGPCKAIGPILEELAVQFDGKAKIVKVNVDEANELASNHAIRSIPTLMLYIDGENKETKVGALRKGQLIEFLNSHGVITNDTPSSEN